MSVATRPRAAHPTRHRLGGEITRWGVGSYLVAVAALVSAILVWLGGTFVYVLDDPAIHLSMADRLVGDGTWGVVAGSFESASSSPLWTVLVAAGVAVTPVGDEWVPLVLNVVAGVGVVLLLVRSLTSPVMRRVGQVSEADQVSTPDPDPDFGADSRPGTEAQPAAPDDVLGSGRLGRLVIVVVVVLALFLPGLAVVGMEHTLHLLLVLAAVVVVQEQASGSGGAPGATRLSWVAVVLLVLATATRFETAFVAVGLAAGLVLDQGTPWRGLRSRWRDVSRILLAAALPVVVFGLGNRAMGGGLLPNSVLGKGQGAGTGTVQADGLSPTDFAGRLARDPLVLVLLSVAVVYLVVTWGRPARLRITAVTLVVATVLHAALADVGWYERYQAYLIALGLYLVLGIVGDLPPELRRRGAVALLILVLACTVSKADLLVRAPLSADDMYRHQYQAGRFLARYYDGEPVATDQLGYISLLHRGPLTDFGGLGDYEVLQSRPADDQELPASWERLADQRGFRVAVTYDTTGVPETWVLGGAFRLDGEPVTGVTTDLLVWATVSEEVDPLQDHLQAFASELPDRVSIELNDWAAFQVAQMAAEPRG